MPAVGPRLRAEREKRDLRLVDVAMATKVGAHHLSALEHGDFEALPDDRSVIAFVRVYAEHLGLDPNEVAAELSRELAAARPSDLAEAGRDSVAAAGPSRNRARLGAWPAVLAAAVALAVAAWWWIAGGAAGESPVPTVPPATGGPGQNAPAQDPTGTMPGAVGDSGPVEAEPAPRDALSRPAPEAAASRLRVPQFGVGTGVADRSLVGEGTRFTEGQRVWFWTLVEGGTAGETIRHVWIHEGRETAGVVLSLGGPRWRTQSRKTLSPGSTGSWIVEARDEAGRVLARSEFVCRPVRDPA